MKTLISKAKILFYAILLIYSKLIVADINIGLFVDQQTHVISETPPSIFITAQNDGTVSVQDVYMVLESPNGTLYSYPNWSTSLQPWLSAFPIPADFILNSFFVVTLDLVPGGLTPGIWHVYFALTTPGTTDINQFQAIDLNVIENLSLAGVVNGSRFGSVAMVRSQSVTGVNVSASASFFESNVSFIDATQALQGTNPTALDQCEFSVYSPNPTNIDNISITSLDAGQVSVSDGATNITLDKNVFESSISYTASPATSFFDNAASFTFNGSGGSGVGAFSVTLPSTSALELLSPEPSTNVEIDPAQDLNLVWTNNNFGVGEVLASLSGTDLDLNNPTNSTVYSISCRFIDDGDGTIPANLLAQLQQALPANDSTPLPGFLPDGVTIPGFGGLTQLTLTVDRTRYKFFNTADPTIDVGFATVSSGVGIQAGFQ